MIISKPHLCTQVDIWSPRYKDKYKKELAQPVVLLAKYKVFHSTGTIIINFTKAKHLMGQRYAITATDAQRYPTETNGKIDCFAIPLDALQTWTSGYDVPPVQQDIFENLELGL